jgi:adenylate cyclase
VARAISIRWSLFQTFLLVVALITVSILVANEWYGAKAVRSLAREALERAAAHADSDLAHFLEPVGDDLENVRQWTRSGLFDPDDSARANALLVPLMVANPQLGIFTTGDASGAHFLLRRETDGWSNREMRGDAPGVARVARWSDSAAPVQWSTRAEAFDHRERPWYKRPILQPPGAPHDWTKPYLAHDSGRPIMTAATRVERPGRPPFVAAFHVFIERISAFTAGLVPSPNGQVFVLDDSSRMLGLPRDPRFETPEGRNAALLKPARDLGIPALAEAVGRWKAQEKPRAPFAFELDGRTWWSGFRQVPLNDRRSLWIGTLVPEDDFDDAIQEQQAAVVTIGFMVILIAAVLAFFLSRAYSRALLQLVEQSARIQDLDLSASTPVRSRLREIAQLAQAQERMRIALDGFSRYVPTELVRELLRRGEAARIGGRTETLTVFFSDIRGFTTISESVPPEALTAQMAEYFGELLAILTEEGATIDKFIGDAIMAFWGAPVPDPEHARHGVNAALRCQARLLELNRAWEQEGRPALPTRIGLATGRVVVGNVGAPTRLNYTLLGDIANLASRLEGANRFYGTDILASSAVRAAAGAGLVWRELDAVAVKGKATVVHVHEPLGLEGEVPIERLDFAERWSRALTAYRARDFEGTLTLLGELSAARREDVSVVRLEALARQALVDPPPPGWAGESTLHDK